MPTPLPWPRAGLYRVSLAFTPSTLTTNNYGPNIDPGYITWKHVTYQGSYPWTIISFVTSSGQVSGSLVYIRQNSNWVGTYNKKTFDFTKVIQGWESLTPVHHVGTLQQEDYRTWTLSGTAVWTQGSYTDSSSYSMTMIGSPSSLGTVCSATPLTIRSRAYLILAFCGKP